MSSSTRTSSKPLDPDRARSLVLDLEQQGIDPVRISMATGRPHDPATTGRVDQATLRRPAKRAATVAAVGVAIGVAIGVLATAFGAQLATALVVGVIMGGLVGALLGLYWRLPMTPEVYDAETGGLSVVSVDLAGLDDELVESVIERVQRA